MKRLFTLITLCFIVGGCQNASYIAGSELETGEILYVGLDKEEYAKKLQAIWNSKYPEYENSIQFINKEEKHYVDVVYISDVEAVKKKNKYEFLGDIKQEVPIARQLHIEAIDDIFMSIEGEGLIYVWNEDLAKEKGLSENSFLSFEKLLGVEQAYYHNHTYAYIYPFLFTNDNVDTPAQYVKALDIEKRVDRYKNLFFEMPLQDDMYAQTNFYNTYISGLISTTSDVTNTALYKKGKLHFTKMPSLSSRQLQPLLTTYGFCIKEDSEVKNLAKTFVEMTRTKEGIQAFLDADEGYPLIEEDYVNDFMIFDHFKKEIIIAMNDSQPTNLNTLETIPNSTISNYLEDSTLTAIVQNYIMGNGTPSTVRERIQNIFE